MSLFVIWDPTARIHLFSELECEDLRHRRPRARRDQQRISTAERLYGDFTLCDALNVRVGKFLTPVGRWNVIHAQPLVWTTSRPLATLLPFDPHTTGAMLLGALDVPDGALSYALYGQFPTSSNRAWSRRLARRSVGSRLDYSAWGGWSIGASYLAFSPRPSAASGSAHGPVAATGSAWTRSGSTDPSR